MRKHLRTSLLTVLVVLPGLASMASPAERPQEGAELDLVSVQDFAGPAGWSWMQAIQSDRKGRVYLLRSEKFEVYPLDRNHKLGKPIKLNALGLEGGTPQQFAAMGDDPGDWIVLGAGLRWFVGGDEMPIQPPNQPVLNVAMLDGDPIAVLAPVKIYQRSGEVIKNLPTLARWDGEEWEYFLDESVAGMENPFGNEAMAARSAVLASDSDRSLWMAQSYTSQIRHFAPTGRLLTTLTTQEKSRRRPAAEIEQIEKDLANQEIAGRADRIPVSKTVTAATLEPFCDAAAVAPDGVIYFLISDPEEHDRSRLRRWDPTRNALEDVAVSIDLPGAATMVWGQDGLHVAQWNAAMGRFFIEKEQLAAALWRPVEGVEVDGASLSGPGDD